MHMNDTPQKTEEKNTESARVDAPETKASPETEASPKSTARPDRRGGKGGNTRERRGRRGDTQGGRERSEFDQKIISLRRVSRVVAGGRRFSFSAAVVAGDRKGRVGVGVGKGIDTALAMDKAFRDAKKNMIRVSMDEANTIPHDVEAKYAASVIELRPAPARGIVAGSSVRTVLEFAGVTDITAKIHSRSKNKINNARATIKALQLLRK
jgi:small subunit ribosomal protein S5